MEVGGKESRTESSDFVSDKPRNGIIVQFLPLVFSIVATLLFRGYIDKVFEPGEFLHNILLPEGDGFVRAIPATIVFLFFWTIGDLVVKLVIVRGQYRSLAQPTVQESPDRVGASDIHAAIMALQDAPARVGSGYVFRVVRTLLMHLKLTNDSQKSHEFIRHQLDLDSDGALSGYTTVRVFIWAMPILGFIGTVLGISFAVGDFSGFLSGDIDDIDRVKRELSKVSTGLAFAFNTTLLGLVASLVAMLLTTYMQRMSEGLLKGVEELCLRIIARVPHGQPQDLDIFDNNELKNSMHAFANVVKTQSEQLRGHFDAFNVSFTRVGKEISKNNSRLTETMENQVGIFGVQMEEMTSQLGGALSAASTAFSNTSAVLSKDLERLPVEIENVRETITQGLSRVTQSNDSLEEIFQSSTQQLVGSQDTLAENVRAIQSTHGLITQITNSLSKELERLPRGLESVRETIGIGLDRLSTSGERFEEIFQSSTQQFVDSQDALAEKVDGIRPTHEMIIQVTHSLNNCNEALRQVREAHDTLVPLLQELKGPMEFKMVPAQRDNGGESG